MASGTSKVQQPGTCHGADGARCSSAGESSRGLHVKMCKKIAQLTKVIYALNTKNDEYEASIQALKEAHEEEIRHILAETRETVLQYKSKAEEEQLLREHIQVLEDAVEQHKRLKEEALAELTLFKKQVDKRELKTEVKQARMILSTDRVDTSAAFESKLLYLSREHEGLLDECKACRRENLDRKEILDEKYSVEGQAQINEMENVKSENQKVTEECTQKTSQLQASYEREKETLKKAIQQSVAETLNCQQRELEQRKSLEAQESFLLQQIKKLEADLEEKTWKVNERKKHSQKLKERIQHHPGSVHSLHGSVADRSPFSTEKWRGYNEWQRCRIWKYSLILGSKCIMKKMEKELNVAKDRNMLQEKKILQKAEEMETILNSHNQAVNEVDELKSQITQMQQMTCTKQSQSKRGCGDIWGLKQELQIQLEEFKKKSESEVKQLEKEKEALTGKLQNSSLEVSQLKEILDQQANNFKESLKKHDLQSSKEKEKLLQDLQNTIKENQNVKLKLESSHQKIVKILEKSKNQELKICLQEAEERLRKEFNETFKIQHQSHKLEIQTLEEKAKKELHDELEQIQKQQTLLLGSLRMELSEQQTLCTRLKKQIEELQMELRSVRTLKKQQARSSQSQIRSLHDELEKSQHEVSGLKKENLLLKDTMELLSAELGSQKQEAAQLQDREKQHRRLLIEDLKVKHKKELDVLKQDHRKEIENMLSDFSSTRAHLQAKIFSLETELKELEEKPRKGESRPEDIHLISRLQDKISEREEIIKQLVEGRKFQPSLLASTESYRNRSFSFNPNLAGLTSSMKQKKIDEVPSRVVSVPNLASYAKSFLSCDLRSKRKAPQIPKSTSLDQSPGCLRMGYLSAQSSDGSAPTRTHDNEALQSKDDQKRNPKHQEWFTKYFSF
ncbi:protein FAM184B isoform X3 [Struthio camelus]|uniref:protein FAM184B isoform X3 n=1 Tax=Struthio camelus TaxID=8801 RepID=UPI003603BAB9